VLRLAEPAPVLSVAVLALRRVPVLSVALLALRPVPELLFAAPPAVLPPTPLSPAALLLRLLVPGADMSLLRSVASGARVPDEVEGAGVAEVVLGELCVVVFCAAAMPSAPAVPIAAMAVTRNFTCVILSLRLEKGSPARPAL